VGDEMFLKNKGVDWSRKFFWLRLEKKRTILFFAPLPGARLASIEMDQARTLSGISAA